MENEKIKVESIDIIVVMLGGRPYYQIKYKEVGDCYCYIGYGSYNLDFVLEWREQYFEVVKNKDTKGTNVPGKWIPCSERIPEEPLELYLVTTKYGSGYQDKVYPCRAFWDGIDFTDGWRSLDVIAWMPLPELYREVE